jgi:hypothetical protein
MRVPIVMLISGFDTRMYSCFCVVVGVGLVGGVSLVGGVIGLSSLQ